MIYISIENEMNRFIKFSIVIPTFNVENYLSKCLDSVLSQTYKNYEVILIDDLSSDKTRKVIDNYRLKDNRIKVIYNKENSGPAYSRQKGIDIAKGEYILFLDSDDWYCNGKLLEKIALIIEEYNSDCICFRYKTFHNHNVVINKKNGPQNGFYNCKDIALLKEKTQSPFWHYLWNKCYKKSVLKKNNIKFNEEMWSAEDVKFNQEFLKYAESFYIITDYMYLYNCQNVFSLTRKSKDGDQDKDLIKMWNNIKNEYLYLKDSYKKLEVSDSCYKYLIANTLLKYDSLLDFAKYNTNLLISFKNTTSNDSVLLECYKNVDKKYEFLKAKKIYINLFKNIKISIKNLIN